MSKITVELDDTLLELLEEEVENAGSAVDELIAEAVTEYLRAAGYALE